LRIDGEKEYGGEQQNNDNYDSNLSDTRPPFFQLSPPADQNTPASKMKDSYPKRTSAADVLASMVE
jgi:hypothetical protein